MLAKRVRPVEFQLKSWAEETPACLHCRACEVFWRRVLDASGMFSSESFHIQKPYEQCFTSYTNLTRGAPNPWLAESVFCMDHPAGVLGRRLLVKAEQKPVLHIMHLLKKFCPPGEMVLDFCMGTGSTPQACLLAPKHYKFFGSKVDNSCFSKAMPSILKAFARQVLKID